MSFEVLSNLNHSLTYAPSLSVRSLACPCIRQISDKKVFEC